MSEEVLIVEDHLVEGSSPNGGAISIWTLNRPDKLNALNSDSHIAIKEQCLRVESDDNIRCVVIRGAPHKFLKRGKQKPQHLQQEQTSQSSWKKDQTMLGPSSRIMLGRQSGIYQSQL